MGRVLDVSAHALVRWEETLKKTLKKALDGTNPVVSKSQWCMEERSSYSILYPPTSHFPTTYLGTCLLHMERFVDWGWEKKTYWLVLKH